MHHKDDNSCNQEWPEEQEYFSISLLKDVDSNTELIKDPFHEQMKCVVNFIITNFNISNEDIHLIEVFEHKSNVWSLDISLDSELVVEGYDVEQYNMGKEIAVLVRFENGQYQLETIEPLSTDK